MFFLKSVAQTLHHVCIVSKMEQQPLKSSEQIVVNDNQQRILQCLACMSQTNEGPLINVGENIEACSGLTRDQRKKAMAKLVQQELVTLSSPTELPQNMAIMGRPVQFTITEAGLQHTTETPAINCANQDATSADPYSHVTNFQRSLLDCVRCITAQGRKPSKHTIALCQTAHSAQSVEQVLRKLVKRDILTATFGSADTLLTDGRRPGATYSPSASAAAFLEPKRKNGCAFLRKEAAQVLKKHSAEDLGILACLACQHQAVQSGECASITLPTISECTGLGRDKVTSRVGTYVKEDLFQYSSDDELPRALLPTQAGKVLILAYNKQYGSQLAANKDIPAHFLESAFTVHGKGDDIFLRATDKSLLSAEEQFRLSGIIQNSQDPTQRAAAIYEFFAKNIRLISSAMRRFQPPLAHLSLERAEKIQIGLVTLYKCVQKFNADHNNKFSVYFYRAFFNELDREIGVQYKLTDTHIHAVRRIASLINQVAPDRNYDNFTDDELLTLIRKHPDKHHINQKKIRIEKAVEVFQRYKRTVSLDRPIDPHNDNEATFGDMLGVEDEVPFIEMKADIEDLFAPANLDDLDRAILQALQRNEALNLKEIARDFDASQTVVSLRHNKIIAVLSHPAIGFLETISNAYDWQLDAACYKNPLFAAPLLGHTTFANLQKYRAVCQTCTVIAKCSDLHGSFTRPIKTGVWGGELKTKHAKKST